MNASIKIETVADVNTQKYRANSAKQPQSAVSSVMGTNVNSAVSSVIGLVENTSPISVAGESPAPLRENDPSPI